jgi:hypothetical protein
MSEVQHHAIVVTGHGNEIEKAYNLAKGTFSRKDGTLSELSEPATNLYQSFCVFPDGSNEGWGTSKEYDALRRIFIKELRYYAVRFIEMSFGDLGYGVERYDDDDNEDGG